MFKVIKRSGRQVECNFHLITKRISILCATEPSLSPVIGPALIAQKVIAGLFDGVTTQQIDELTAETAAAMTTVHPDYGILAARIAMSNLHKRTNPSFSENIYKLAAEGRINERVRDAVEANATELDELINHSMDFEYNYFGIKTLEKSYLLKDQKDNIVERPQHMLMRVCVALWGSNLNAIEETYKELSLQKYTHATPTLFNAATTQEQLSSCFLVANQKDSLDGLMSTIKDVASISAKAGGVGIHIHDVRAKGSAIKGSGGVSNGLMPLYRNYNETARWWDQCFDPNTMVLTTKGYREIRLISPGEFVKTLDGGFAPVRENKKHTTNQPMVQISTASGDVSVTKEHPLLVIEDSARLADSSIKAGLIAGTIKPVWKEAGLLTDQDVLLKY